MRDQLRSTYLAGRELAMAHVDLAKAEATEIGREAGKVAGYVAAAITLLILAATLFIFGTSLFLGEWILGSLGWGVLHGILLFVAVALSCVLLALDHPASRIGLAVLLGIVVGVIVALIFLYELPNRAYTAIGDAVATGIDPDIRPLVVGAAIWALVGFAVGIWLAFRLSGAGARARARNGGIVLGGLFGAFTAITFDDRMAIGMGIAAGYLTWIVVMAIDIARSGVDVEALKARFTPNKSIEMGKETLEWLQNRMPPGIGS
jgi:hypothetical protein